MDRAMHYNNNCMSRAYGIHIYVYYIYIYAICYMSVSLLLYDLLEGV